MNTETPSPTKVKFAVIGCGHIGKRHLKAIAAEPTAQLAALCDIDKTILTKLQESYPNIPVYTSYQNLLQAYQSGELVIDIVSICTPHGLHQPMSIAAAQAGLDVVVEKPMALHTNGCKKMIDAAQANNTKLFIVKQNRYNIPIALTQQALAANKLGKIFMVQCNVLWNRQQAYYNQSPWRGSKALEGGALHTQVCHFIDLLIWWFGDVVNAKAITDTLNHNIEIEDCGVAALRFSNGVIGSLTWTTCVYNVNYEGSITIIGEKGTIKIGGRYLNQIEFWDVQGFPLPTETDFNDLPNTYGTYQGSSSNHPKMFKELVVQIMSKKVRSGIVEGTEGSKTIAAIEKIYASAKNNS